MRRIVYMLALAVAFSLTACDYDQLAFIRKATRQVHEPPPAECRVEAPVLPIDGGKIDCHPIDGGGHVLSLPPGALDSRKDICFACGVCYYGCRSTP